MKHSILFSGNTVIWLNQDEAKIIDQMNLRTIPTQIIIELSYFLKFIILMDGTSIAMVMRFL